MFAPVWKPKNELVPKAKAVEPSREVERTTSWANAKISEVTRTWLES